MLTATSCPTRVAARVPLAWYTYMFNLLQKCAAGTRRNAHVTIVAGGGESAAIVRPSQRAHPSPETFQFDDQARCFDRPQTDAAIGPRACNDLAVRGEAHAKDPAVVAGGGVVAAQILEHEAVVDTPHSGAAIRTNAAQSVTVLCCMNKTLQFCSAGMKRRTCTRFDHQEGKSKHH